MGSISSKSINESAGLEQKNDLSVAANPDPRSPTPEITRTPLQNKNGSKHNITKNVDLRKTFESGQVDEKLIHNNPILSAVIKNHLQSYDPRSPTQEFERTPIVIQSNDENVITDKNILRLQTKDSFASPCLKNDLIDNNSNADREELKPSPDLVVAKNLCDGFYDISPNETLKEIDEPLGSSTTSNNGIESHLSPENIDKPTKLLETNFDYVESENKIIEDNCDNVEEITDVPAELKHIPYFEIIDDDPRSPSLGIDRTPIVVAKSEDVPCVNNVEELSDDILIKVLQSSSNDEPEEEEGNNGLLVYEDEAVVFDTPKKVSGMNNNSNRTPLSCMKNKGDMAHTRSKSANNYDQKKELSLPVKHLKYVSHIPRLKSLSKHTPMGSSVSLKNISRNSVISGDCENTPPHSHRDIWDKDSSIVL